MKWLVQHFLALSTSDITNITNSLQDIVNSSLNKLENMTDPVRMTRSLIDWNIITINSANV